MNRWYGCDLPKNEAEKFKQFLKVHNIKYEPSECFQNIHFEINIKSYEELEMIRYFLKTGEDPNKITSLNLAIKIMKLTNDIDHYEIINNIDDEESCIRDIQSMLSNIKNIKQIKSYFQSFSNDLNINNENNKKLIEKINNILQEIDCYVTTNHIRIKQQNWECYLNYLKNWMCDNKDSANYGKSPQSFDEYFDF